MLTAFLQNSTAITQAVGEGSKGFWAAVLLEFINAPLLSICLLLITGSLLSIAGSLFSISRVMKKYYQ